MIGQFVRMYLSELGVEAGVLIQEAFCLTQLVSFLFEIEEGSAV